MENKIKYLEFIQAVIERMANNSFLLKGWCLTLVSALLGLAAKDSEEKFVVLLIFPIFMFWLLDAYYLRQERLFRRKYDEVSESSSEILSFSLNTSGLERKADSWLNVAFSQTLLLFYGSMAIVAMLVYLVI